MQQDYKPSWIKISLLALGVIALAVGGYFLVKKMFTKPAPKQVYEALVAVTDQKNSDPVEDARSSLKAGDVLVVLPEGHSWSDTEKISYLILKLNLTEEEAQKLLAPETKEAEPKKVEPSDTGKAELSDRQSSALDKQMETARGELVETVRARAYRLKIETLGFDLQKFWENSQQPFQDKTYDWGLAEKK